MRNMNGERQGGGRGVAGDAEQRENEQSHVQSSPTPSNIDDTVVH